MSLAVGNLNNIHITEQEYIYFTTFLSNGVHEELSWLIEQYKHPISGVNNPQ